MIFSFPFNIDLIKPDNRRFKSSIVYQNTSLIMLKERQIDTSLIFFGKEIFVDYFLIGSILQKPNSLTNREKNLINLIMKKANKDIQATKKINGYSVLNTKTLEILWISEYDYNNIAGYYADDKSESNFENKEYSTGY